jgi:hypothetical protein
VRSDVGSVGAASLPINTLTEAPSVPGHPASALARIRCRSAGPLVGEGLQLADDLVDGVLLLLGWVAVSGQRPFDDGAEFGLDVVAGGPVGGQVAA